MDEYSPKFPTVSDHYKDGFWNATMVHNAVGRWITEEEEKEILSEKEA